MTEIVNHSTGEITNRPSYADVRTSIETTRSHLERAAEQVVWQIENRAWEVLGYASWDEMREAEYKGAAVIVPRADRPELAARIRSTGLTNQQVADTIGVSEATARREGNRHLTNTATITDASGRTRPTNYAKTSTSTPPTTEAVGESTGSSKVDVDAAPEVGAEAGPEERDEAHATPPPASGPTATDIAASDASVQDARYLANFYAAIGKASTYRTFDAERIGRIGTEDDIQTLELEAFAAQDFLERAKRARSGLRVIKGGRA